MEIPDDLGKCIQRYVGEVAKKVWKPFVIEQWVHEDPMGMKEESYQYRHFICQYRHLDASVVLWGRIWTEKERKLVLK